MKLRPRKNNSSNKKNINMRNDRPPIRPADKKTQNETIRAMARATSDHISPSSYPAARIKEQLDRLSVDLTAR